MMSRTLSLAFGVFLLLLVAPADAAQHGPRLHEPLYFDLVRGLGARAGEIEMNTLVNESWFGTSGQVTWAPEVEVAVFDGVAFELELPHEGACLTAVKEAMQLSFANRSYFFRHGLQLLHEHALDMAGRSISALYLFGFGSGPWSLLAMLGGRVDWPGSRIKSLRGLANATVFSQFSKKVTVGLETNLDFSMSRPQIQTLRFLPQLHYDFASHLSMQFGAGFQSRSRDGAFLGSVRLIVQ